MGCGGSFPTPPSIGVDFTDEIQEATGELIGSIPIAYTVERQRIIDEMRRASPHPYQGLLFVDYPAKNGPQVSALARRVVTSAEAKQQISDQVNERLQEKIESETTGMNPAARAAACKAIKKSIEVAVDRAVNAIVFNDNNAPTTATPSSR